MLRQIRRAMGAVSRLAMGTARKFGRALGWDLLSGRGRMRNEGEILSLLGSNSRLGSPVDAIATDVSRAEWVLKKRVKGELVEVGRLGTGHNVSQDPLLVALNRPTYRLGWSAWLYVLTTWRLACGFAPIWLQERDGSGRPSSLQPVGPDEIQETRPRVNHEGQPYFVIRQDGLTENVLEKDLLWPFRVDPKDSRGAGLGKARGVEDDVSADESMSAFNAAYFANGAVLGPVLNIPGGDLDTLKKEWRQERKGVLNFHKPLLTNTDSPIQLVNTTPGMKDLAMSEGRLLGRDFILQAFHVSQARIGVLNGATRAEIEGSDLHQAQNCVLPELIYWREFFNQHLVPLWGSDYFLDFVTPVKQTAEFHRLLAETGVRGGWLTVNEARKLHNFEQLDGGDMLLIPVNNVIMLDVRGGIKVPDIATQLRMNGGQKVEPTAKELALTNALKAFLQETSAVE